MPCRDLLALALQLTNSSESRGAKLGVYLTIHKPEAPGCSLPPTQHSQVVFLNYFAQGMGSVSTLWHIPPLGSFYWQPGTLKPVVPLPTPQSCPCSPESFLESHVWNLLGQPAQSLSSEPRKKWPSSQSRAYSWVPEATPTGVFRGGLLKGICLGVGPARGSRLLAAHVGPITWKWVAPRQASPG